MRYAMSNGLVRVTIAVSVVAATLAVGAAASAQDRPLTQKAALETAFEHNPSLQSVLIERRRARLLVESEESRYVPTFTGEAGYRRQRLPSLSPMDVRFLESNSVTASGTLRHTFVAGTSVSAGLEGLRTEQSSIVLGDLGAAYGLDVTLQLTQPWLRGFSRDVVEAQLRIARAQRDAVDAQLAERASALARDVLSAYWQVWLAQQRVDIQRDAIELARAELRDAQNRLSAGELAESDLIALQTEIASTEEQLTAARATLEQQWVELERLMGAKQVGREGADVRTIVDTSPPDIEAIPDRKAAVARAEEASYQLRQLEPSVAVARVESDVADNQKLVRLDSTASLQVSGLERDPPAVFEQVGTIEGWAAFVGVSVEVPTANRFSKARAERAELAVESAEQTYRDAADSIQARVSSLITELRATRERLALAQRTAELTRRLVAAESARFDAGEATALDVTRALQQRREAELRVVQARIDLVTRGFELRVLTGELLDDLDIEP